MNGVCTEKVPSEQLSLGPQRPEFLQMQLPTLLWDQLGDSSGLHPCLMGYEPPVPLPQIVIES